MDIFSFIIGLLIGAIIGFCAAALFSLEADEDKKTRWMREAIEAGRKSLKDGKDEKNAKPGFSSNQR